MGFLDELMEQKKTIIQRSHPFVTIVKKILSCQSLLFQHIVEEAIVINIDSLSIHQLILPQANDPLNNYCSDSDTQVL